MEIRSKFNKDFDAVVKLKRAEADKVLDLNTRIEETVRGVQPRCPSCRNQAPSPLPPQIHDLTALGAAPPPEERFVVPFPEDMKHVLVVKDAEVMAERVLTEAERAKEDAKRARDDDHASKHTDTHLAERALKQMMGGTLASKQIDDDPFKMERPAWMDGNPKLFSDVQLKEVREFQAQEKVMLEEKAKKVAGLELELRSFKGSVEDCIQKIDDALQVRGARLGWAALCHAGPSPAIRGVTTKAPCALLPPPCRRCCPSGSRLRQRWRPSSRASSPWPSTWSAARPPLTAWSASCTSRPPR